VRWLRDRVRDLILRLDDTARQNPLTQLLNRRGVEQRLVAELARSARTGEPLSVLVADLDGFKTLNDRLGHRAGDAALVQIGRLLERESRRMDSVGRLGGDEFVVVMPNAAGDDAAAAGARLCAAVRGTFAAATVPVTLSVGTGVYQTTERRWSSCSTLPTPGSITLRQQVATAPATFGDRSVETSPWSGPVVRTLRSFRA
jgi:diguanylate cyclase (GGDEF)-like protein